MKIYKIKCFNKIFNVNEYLKGVVFNTDSGELSLEPIIANTEDEIAWYEEDKAKKYVELLNKDFENFDFEIEFVKEIK